MAGGQMQDLVKLVHELQVQKAELEGQNEELRRALAQLEKSITVRKEADDALRAAETNYREALQRIIVATSKLRGIRDPYTARHECRVTELACAIAAEMGFAQERIEVIRLSSYIHDSGMLGVPLEILMYRTRLHEIQMGMIKIHPQNAYDLLADMDLPQPLALTIWQHHERLDGSGYPRQLRGNDIIPEARILAVADVFEAMASSRPYRPALGIDKALEEISGNRGKLYDPAAADTCLKLVKEKGFKFTEPGLRDTFN